MAAPTISTSHLPSGGNDSIGSGFNDDPLWLILSTAAYLKETGDWGILQESVTYESIPGSEEPLYDHLTRGVRYTLDRLGPHGLPLIGRADWNDCLNLNVFSEDPDDSFQTAELKSDGSVAESVFIAGLFVVAVKEMAAIARRQGQDEEAETYLEAAAQMQAAVNEYGWDGGWFLRAYDAFGNKVGSQACDEGQIYVEPQGLCVMAGIGLESERAEQALDAVYDRLATEHGILLHQPPYHATAHTWARSRPTLRDTKRTAASSVTPTPG